MEAHQVAQLLSQTLSPDAVQVHSATDALDRISVHPNFSFCLLSIASGSGGEYQGLQLAAAAYLKNFSRRTIDGNVTISKEFKDALLLALLQAESAVLKVLIEVFRIVVNTEFLKKNSWPELVSELKAAIQSSDLIVETNSRWKTVNALTIFHSLIRPFQYFLDPKLAKEPVPPQLELISEEILVPLVSLFDQLAKKVTSSKESAEPEKERVLLITCKCIYYAVRSHMPSALVPLLSSFCQNLFEILGSLNFNVGTTPTYDPTLRLKTGKRSLLIFCALVTRHRKFSDRLLPDITGCALKIVKHSALVSELDFSSERVISLAFDVLSHILETGPGWRLVSPHFSTLLESAIFPALIMNEKDKAEWEEDADEYIRKNIPSELDEASGWRDDLFTARKSALNLLGIIAISKGPPVTSLPATSKRKKGEKNKRKDRSSVGELLVLPFLSKFPIPSHTDIKAINEYYGVLMAYSSLLEFLKEQTPGYTTTVIQNRLLPLYTASFFQPYLVASANWVLGELASCIPEELTADIYSSLTKALTTPDTPDVSCYPVRMSAAATIAQLVENDYMPHAWLPLLQAVAEGINNAEESATIVQLLGQLVEAGDQDVAPHIPHIVSLLVQTISSSIPPKPEPWPQMVEKGFAALAVMSESFKESAAEPENESAEIWASGKDTIKRAFSDLLQHAWLRAPEDMDDNLADSMVSPSCIDDTSTMLVFIMENIVEFHEIEKLKVSELLLAWSNSIADWNAWEETEDLPVFDCIKEAINLNKTYFLRNFFVGTIPSPPAAPVSQRSIIEGIGSFVSDALSQYPSAVWRASSCVHMLLHSPFCGYEGKEVKQSLAEALSKAAFERLNQNRNKPCPLWKPLLLALASCYLCHSDAVEDILQKNDQDGFTFFASALAFILSSKCEYSLSTASGIKIAVLSLAKIIERLHQLGNPNHILLKDCLTAIIEASVKFQELQEEEDEEECEEGEDGGSSDDEEEDDDDDVDSESEEDEHEETEEEFLERYAKAARELDNEAIVEEDETEDQEQVQEIQLGALEEIDMKMTILSLMEKCHVNNLLQGVPPLPSEVISGFLSAFPECRVYLQQLN